MKYLPFTVILAVYFFTGSTNGLSCLPCESRNCTKPECDSSGYTLGVCGCCTVCSKSIGQSCGGIWNLEGTCDKNLTCNQTAEEYEFGGGQCTDTECLAVVDIVFLVDGSSEGAEKFNSTIKWMKNATSKMYQTYGACTNVEFVQYSGTGSEITYQNAVNFGMCINNDDCLERKLDNFLPVNKMGKLTFDALYGAASHFQGSSRFPRSQRIVIVGASGHTLDPMASEQWLIDSKNDGIMTYGLRLGATDEEIVNITGTLDNAIDPDPARLGDFIDKLWSDTVNIDDNCEFPEEYTPCKSTSCEATCSDMFRHCPLNCDTTGCRCASGYVRVSETNKTCVSYAGCTPYNCPLGETYFDPAPLCEPTCDDPNPPCDGSIGPAQCKCMKGYVRHNGICIPEMDCPKETGNCSYGEEYSECSSNCTPTCENPHPICFGVCGPPKCQCKPGYVMHNGSCMPYEYCSKNINCTYGETYAECSTFCEPTCDNPHPVCIEMCGPGMCQCMTGYVRHEGSCIPMDKCPNANCSYGETYEWCSTYCEPTCENPYPSCIQICGPGMCQCMTGYVRHKGTCIPMDKCPKPANCSEGEVYMECSSPCTRTCDDPHLICPGYCAPPKCECLPGYARHEGICIPHHECPVKKCMKECPMIQSGESARSSAEAWMCHFSNWRCTLYKWKTEIEHWWYASGCNDGTNADMEEAWGRLFECPEQIGITCSDASQYDYDFDAFGCKMGSCRDGHYKDMNQLLKMWSVHYMKYQEKVEHYKKATALCQQKGCVHGTK